MSTKIAFLQSKKILLTAAVLLGTAVVSPVSAATATFTSDHCSGSGGCTGSGQPGGFATIEATQIDANTVGITITPLNGNHIIGSGLTTFTFNLTNDATITYSPLPSGFDVVNSTTNTQTAGVIHNNGFGDFEYGIDYSPNGAPGFIGPLSFQLTSPGGLTLANFGELSTGGDVAAFFALDILSGTNGNTGLVDCCVGRSTPFQVSTVPLPAAFPLFAGGLGVMGVLGWRRRRKAAAA